MRGKEPVFGLVRLKDIIAEVGDDCVIQSDSIIEAGTTGLHNTDVVLWGNDRILLGGQE